MSPSRRIRFRDRPRAHAAAVVRALTERGLEVRLLSDDRRAAVAAVARELGIRHWRTEAPAGR